jgi:hypothetical protein
VLVLEGGRAVELGTPEELRARGGAYAELAAVQRRAERLRRELDPEPAPARAASGGAAGGGGGLGA